MKQTIPCPHYSKPLFASVLVDPRGVWAKADGPAVENNHEGYFVVRLSCNKQVRLEVVPSPAGPGSGAGLRVAERQK